MQTNKSVFFIILIFLTVHVNSLNPLPPLWPEQMTIISHSTFPDDRPPSSLEALWYDSIHEKQRHDYFNSYSKYACDQIFGRAGGPCTYLITNHTGYYYSSDKNLCCSNGEASIKQRNWLSSYSYAGKQIINGYGCDLWTKQGKYGIQKYYSFQDEKRQPKMAIYTVPQGQIVFNYIPDSYSENQIDLNTFELPSYCKSAKACPQSQQLNVSKNIVAKSEQKMNKSKKQLKNV